MSTRKEQKEERYEAILMAGMDLFIEKGFKASKIADLAKRAKMSTGLLFHYFESKEKLYEELVKIGLEGTKNIMHYDTASPIAFFEQIAKMILESLVESTFTAKMFVLMGQSYYGDAPESIKKIIKEVNNIEQSVPIMEAGQRLGEIRDGNPLALSFTFWSSIQGVAESLAVSPHIPCPDYQWIVDIIRKK